MHRIEAVRIVYEGWARFLVADLRMPDGLLASRVVEDHGDAVAVLPYDPERRTALLVRQVRAALALRGADAVTLEVPAGKDDHGDSETSARGEALEEAGVRLGALEPVLSAWTMPGISTERAHLFLARYGASDRVAAGGGLAAEGETVEVEEIALADLAAMADAGALTELKAFALVMALRIRRPDLFAPV